MMNFSGQNRGFAYAKYGSSALATTAIRLLHGHMLEPGCRLSVRRSIEKRHLSIWDLPATTRQEDLLQVGANIIASSVSWVTFVSHDFHTLTLTISGFNSEICPNIQSIGV